PSLLLSRASVHARDLHASPTRRSADLCGESMERPVFCVQGGSRNTIGQSRQNRTLWDGQASCAFHNVRFCLLCPIVFLLPPCTQDRKSTRLNSSHVSISYAVFCLKQKT